MAQPACGHGRSLSVQAGRRYLLCMCGRSSKKPLCDGSHAGAGKLPYFFTATDNGSVQVCGCYQTTTRPLCDASQPDGTDSGAAPAARR